MAKCDDPVMIVVGGDAIALSTAQELCALQGHRVVVLWRRDPDLARAIKSIGAEFVAAARPDSAEGLNGAAARRGLYPRTVTGRPALLHTHIAEVYANAELDPLFVSG